MNKSEYKRFACIGPGGWKCSCCTPAPPGKKMKLFFRIWKKRERIVAFKDIEQQLSAPQS